MRFSTTAILATALGWIGAVTAHNIQLKAHSMECFHEQLHKDDKMTVTFQVGDREFGGSGNLEIDFWVRDLLLPADKTSHRADAVVRFPNLADRFDSNYRSRIPFKIVSITKPVSLRKTTLSRLIWTANTSTASAISVGPRIRRKYRSTSTVSSTSRNLSRKTHWRLRV